jgi:thiamine pyrophosphate-dependent acetolactate synthase large subunit-like protein
VNVAAGVVEILKREGVEFIIGYPSNPLFEAGAEAGVRPIVVRQERTGVHMADAISRVTSGKTVGVAAMQFGPGVENAFGAVAQAYSESVPVLVIPAGYPRDQANVSPRFSALLNFQQISKNIEQVNRPEHVVRAMRRAMTQVKNGRPRPVVLEIPFDLFDDELSGEIDYEPAPRRLSAPDPQDVDRVAQSLLDADNPVIYAGQGVHYAEAWDALRDLAEALEAPVTTSLEGKSAFPETHRLSLGSGGRAVPGPVYHFIQNADLIFGVGCSFARTSYGIQFPADKSYIQATLDPGDINRDLEVDDALVGDARLTLEMLLEAVRERLNGASRGRADDVASEIARLKSEWQSAWSHKTQSDGAPLSPYRVIRDLNATVDVPNTIITHDAGSPRDQLSPFWVSDTPLSYIGWGKTTQLGYGLGLAMGAKLAKPDKHCINVWGDAAIGMTGMDFETAARLGIPITSVLFNNGAMAIEFSTMEAARARYDATAITGNYSEMARAFGGYGERITEAGEIVPAIQRAIEQNENGVPALLEFITAQETEYSVFP